MHKRTRKTEMNIDEAQHADPNKNSQPSQSAGFWLSRIFRKSVRDQIRYKQLLSMLGNNPSAEHGLVIGGSSALIDQLLRLPGMWYCAIDDTLLPPPPASIPDPRIIPFTDLEIPVKDEQFDCIILIDVLEVIDEDRTFIAECHRTLKKDGKLLIFSQYKKKYSLLYPLRTLFRIKPVYARMERDGYDTALMFDLLKDGFDVSEVRCFSRFFFESTNLFSRYLEKWLLPEPASYASRYRFMQWTHLFEWMASGMDRLIFFTRGFTISAHAKKRIWRSRTPPKLSDGRSIAEATLGGKIGTALDY